MILFPSTPAVPSPRSPSARKTCMVFVAFATWAVRTSDLHAPDAWKTGLWGRGGGWAGVQKSSGGAVVSKSQLLGFSAGMRGPWGGAGFSPD